RPCGAAESSASGSLQVLISDVWRRGRPRPGAQRRVIVAGMGGIAKRRSVGPPVPAAARLPRPPKVRILRFLASLPLVGFAEETPGTYGLRAFPLVFQGLGHGTRYTTKHDADC